MHFVADKATKFALAVECGDLAVAQECAAALNLPECWQQLGAEALRQGNHAVRPSFLILLSFFLSFSFYSLFLFFLSLSSFLSRARAWRLNLVLV
jgi:hypothetical protein